MTLPLLKIQPCGSYGAPSLGRQITDAWERSGFANKTWDQMLVDHDPITQRFLASEAAVDELTIFSDYYTRWDRAKETPGE